MAIVVAFEVTDKEELSEDAVSDADEVALGDEMFDAAGAMLVGVIFVVEVTLLPLLAAEISKLS